MLKRICSFALMAVMLLSCTACFFACSEKIKTDPELEDFQGELYTEILKIKNGAKGIITIVHDDGVYETVEFMKEQFDEYEGLCASVAMMANNVVSADGTENSSAEKWKTIISEGNFDIVGHSQTHSWYGMGDDGESGQYPHRDGYNVPYNFPAGHMTNEIAGAADRLAKVFGQDVLCFALVGFPTVGSEYNGQSEKAKEIMANRFIAVRNMGGSGTFGDKKLSGVNNLDDLDYQRLHAFGISTEQDYETEWYGCVDNAVNYGGWGIFLFHAMVNNETSSTYGVAKSKASDLFGYIYDYVAIGELWCATLTEAAQYTNEFKTAKAEVSVSGEGISVTVTDELDDSLYYAPLTVKVQVLDSWNAAVVEQNGVKTEVPVYTDENGSSYILADIVPDKGVAVINKIINKK